MNHNLAVHEESKGEFTLRVYCDDDPLNCREDTDNFGTMATWHRRYMFGDTTKYSKDISNIRDPNRWLRELACKEVNTYVDPDVIPSKNIKAILNKHFLILPLSIYDHSGVTMWVGSGEHWSDPGGWDSGQVGWIYVRVKDALENWSCSSLDDLVAYPDGTSKTCRERALDLLRAEVEEFDHYLTGEVYGYEIENSDGDVVDSCWEFYGDYRKYMLGEAREQLDYYYNSTPEQKELPFEEPEICLT